MRELIAFSRKYGADPALVLAGGGNTSMKEDGVLYVKGSGCALAAITASDFVAMDCRSLAALVEKPYPEEDRAREAAFLADVLAARLPGEEGKRPSVEALLHALFPQRYVLHLHPALVNGLTCARDGAAHARRLFPEAAWVEACRPGYTLAKRLAASMGPGTDTVLLQNHGVFFAAETAAELEEKLRHMLAALSAETGALPEVLPEVDLAAPFTPDQVVYCGTGPGLPDTENARLLYTDARKIAAYARAFGGAQPMSRELTEFIVNWEAEAYRKSRADGGERA